jgi:hypothetical protein
MVRWHDHKLDCLHFPLMASVDAFDFVDPKDVLHACHIILAFAEGKMHSDGIGLSRCAGDAHDWNSYYVNRYILTSFNTGLTCNFQHRFVDRNVLMRFYWGFGIGYTYAHNQTSLIPPPKNVPLLSNPMVGDSESGGTSDSVTVMPADDTFSHNSDFDDQELQLENRDDLDIDLGDSEEQLSFL